MIQEEKLKLLCLLSIYFIYKYFNYKINKY